jgi:hypothetical protein
MWNFTDDSDKSNSNLENVNHACIGLAPYLCSPECLDFIYSLSIFTFFF